MVVFAVNRWLGVNGTGDCSSLKVSTIRGRLFTIFITSQNSVRRPSSSRCELDFINIGCSTLRTVLISLSHTPPMWDACGTLNLNSETQKLLDLTLIHGFVLASEFILGPRRNWYLYHTSTGVLDL